MIAFHSLIYSFIHLLNKSVLSVCSHARSHGDINNGNYLIINSFTFYIALFQILFPLIIVNNLWGRYFYHHFMDGETKGSIIKYLLKGHRVLGNWQSYNSISTPLSPQLPHYITWFAPCLLKSFWILGDLYIYNCNTT